MGEICKVRINDTIKLIEEGTSFEEIAKESTRILFNVIRKKSMHTHKFFEGELVVRESTNKIEKNSAD